MENLGLELSIRQKRLLDWQSLMSCKTSTGHCCDAAVGIKEEMHREDLNAKLHQYGLLLSKIASLSLQVTSQNSHLQNSNSKNAGEDHSPSLSQRPAASQRYDCRPLEAELAQSWRDVEDLERFFGNCFSDQRLFTSSTG